MTADHKYYYQSVIIYDGYVHLSFFRCRSLINLPLLIIINFNIYLIVRKEMDKYFPVILIVRYAIKYPSKSINR